MSRSKLAKARSSGASDLHAVMMHTGSGYSIRAEEVASMSCWQAEVSKAQTRWTDFRPGGPATWCEWHGQRCCTVASQERLGEGKWRSMVRWIK